MTRERWHEIIEGQDPEWGRVSLAVQQGLLLFALGLFSISTLPGEQYVWMRAANAAVVLCFAAEYGLRLWAAPDRRGYAFGFWGIVDFLAFAPMILFAAYDTRAIRALRFIQLLRLLKFARYTKAVARMQLAMAEVKDELIVAVVMAAIVLYLSAVGIWVFEHEAQPDKFGSVFHCLWWAIATLTTVGYGDVYPITLGGRIFTGVILVIGLAVVAIPTGVVSAALMREDREEEAD